MKLVCSGPGLFDVSAARSAAPEGALSSGQEESIEQPVLSQSILNIADKRRSNPLTWKGQFSPQLVEAHLLAYAQPGDCVLDPFAGSGTVMFEGLRAGMQPIGVEINPAAVTLARLYSSAGVEQSKRCAALASVERALDRVAARFATVDGLLTDEPGAAVPSVLSLLNEFPRPSLELDFVEALIVSCDVYQRPPWSSIAKRWQELRALVASLPFAATAPRMYLADARALPVEDASVELVFTSPPYINVFNYHQQYRASVEAIGWDVLPIARSEIGSNRKFRGNRLFTVTQYCLDMALCLLEVRRVIKPDGRAIFVVGRESNVRKTAFFNGDILAALARESAGFEIALQQERVFQNRFGVAIIEDILHLKKDEHPPRSKERALTTARLVAKRVLGEVRLRASEASIVADIDEAITKVDDIEPSPLVGLAGEQRLTSTLHAERRSDTPRI